MSYRYQESQTYYGDYLKQAAYRHLTTALLLATVVVTLILAVENPPIGIYYIGAGLEGIIIFGLIISALFRVQFSESTATVILYIFAIASSITLGYLVDVVLLLSNGLFIVTLTFGMAFVTVFGMYTYTSINKPDVSHLQKRVLIFTLLFIVFSFIGMFIFAQVELFYIIVSGVGALLFAVFMYMDFARLERQEFSSPAMMALMLFYDIIFFIKYLLMFLVQVLGER